MELTEIEVRVLGSLVEKSLTTPEYYPMSPNAVMNACNQKSSREPVVSYDETVVVRALFSLRDKGLVWEKSEAGSRVTKYAHRFENISKFSPAEVAALCLLMLRGPQTPGEIKSRSGRMHEFASPAEVDSVLNGLMTRPDQPFVTKLARQTGHKEARFAHLLSGEAAASVPAAEPAVSPSSLEARVTALERQVAELSKKMMVSLAVFALAAVSVCAAPLSNDVRLQMKAATVDLSEVDKHVCDPIAFGFPDDMAGVVPLEYSLCNISKDPVELDLWSVCGFENWSATAKGVSILGSAPFLTETKQPGGVKTLAPGACFSGVLPVKLDPSDKKTADFQIYFKSVASNRIVAGK